jgi:hypothetical protein
LKVLEVETARVKRIVADQTLEVAALEIAKEPGMAAELHAHAAAVARGRPARAAAAPTDFDLAYG